MNQVWEKRQPRGAPGWGRQTQSGPQTARDDKDVSRAVHAPCAAGVLHLSLPFIISDARV